VVAVLNFGESIEDGAKEGSGVNHCLTRKEHSRWAARIVPWPGHRYTTRSDSPAKHQYGKQVSWRTE